jgi:hypothetical protein
VRNHGYMIYDTLFSTDASGEIKPQMVGNYAVSIDKMTYTFTLREGLLIGLPKIFRFASILAMTPWLFT